MADFPDRCCIVKAAFVLFYLRFPYPSCKTVVSGVSSDLRFVPQASRHSVYLLCFLHSVPGQKTNPKKSLQA